MEILALNNYVWKTLQGCYKERYLYTISYKDGVYVFLVSADNLL